MISEPGRPNFANVSVRVELNSVLIDTNNGANPVIVSLGHIDNYVLLRSSNVDLPTLVSPRGESMNITDLLPGSFYNFTFVSQILACGGVNGTSELYLLNICTS